ncbi:MAG TPA: DUF6463 family protein [Stackebrandtia sp.]|uniref:DUF6463 family protein n=1 Tax=Stackebrandtia sp. TaxID=2023065 RepID=UPI002D438648|nr:DUF6463 family protein [Stackebrandtia sp.]HZE38923.1 DUF6463 family protein [Stackebrandtia sp.]
MTNAIKPRRLALWGGYTMAAIACLHILFFSINPYWSQWLSGGLWSHRAGQDSMTYYWALPGGFAVIMIMLGLLISRLAKRGEPLPAYMGWVVLAWVAVNIAMIGVSGFVAGVIPAALLIADSLKARRQPA